MKANLARHRAEPRRVRRRLVDADDAELANRDASRIRGEPDETSDFQPLGFSELPRHQDGSGLVILRVRSRHNGSDENEKQGCETSEQRESHCGQGTAISL